MSCADIADLNSTCILCMKCVHEVAPCSTLSADATLTCFGCHKKETDAASVLTDLATSPPEKEQKELIPESAIISSTEDHVDKVDPNEEEHWRISETNEMKQQRKRRGRKKQYKTDDTELRRSPRNKNKDSSNTAAEAQPKKDSAVKQLFADDNTKSIKPSRSSRRLKGNPPAPTSSAEPMVKTPLEDHVSKIDPTPPLVPEATAEPVLETSVEDHVSNIDPTPPLVPAPTAEPVLETSVEDLSLIHI